MSNRDAWLAARRTGIGGSDAAAVMGLSKYKTPYQVWADKVGMLPAIEETAPMRWGNYLEPAIRQAYCDETGREVLQGEMTRKDFQIANLDGWTQCGRVVEIKTARSSDGWGEAGTDQVPMDYLMQVQHYMMVTGYAVADIAVLIGGSDFRLYEVPADGELHGMMLEAQTALWKRVLDHNPPVLECIADAQLAYRVSAEAVIEASELVAYSVKTLRDIRAQIKLLEKDEEAEKALIMAYMAENDTLKMGEQFLATWRSDSGRTTFDSKALEAAHPEIYKQYLKTSAPARRFLIK